MLCKEIMQVIEAAYPKSAALDFDNVGLLAGRAEKEVNRVYLALDATDKVIDRAVLAGADMLIANSRDVRIIHRLMDGQNLGTLFVAHRDEDFDLPGFVSKLN